jgi:2-(1,2-epoxy-1,2-dihydrophenyl)acetyl-CoA isomerase
LVTGEVPGGGAIPVVASGDGAAEPDGDGADGPGSGWRAGAPAVVVGTRVPSADRAGGPAGVRCDAVIISTATAPAMGTPTIVIHDGWTRPRHHGGPAGAVTSLLSTGTVQVLGLKQGPVVSAKLGQMVTKPLQEKYGDVEVTGTDDHVAVVTIHRPPDNYFDAGLIASLADAYEAVDEDPDCRAIVLRSEGKHFCAGASLGPSRDTSSLSTIPGRHLYDEAVRIFSAATPVVAAIQGAAIGGGLGLALSADFRIGAPEARFSANFARLGFHHGFGLTVTLPDAVGRQKALDLLYTGRRINGEEAGRIGLLDGLVPQTDLERAAHDFAAEIAASAPLAVVSIRQTMRGDLPERIRVATTRERAEQDRLTRTADFAEGVTATAERRAPKFSGR